MSGPREIRRTLEEDVFVPPHPERQETSAYRRIHHQLVIIEDRPCWSCGVRHSTLGSLAANPHRAERLETHHILEWSLADCLDVDKVNRLHLPFLRLLGYDGPDLSPETLPDFVDHSRFNLVVLCDQCHRSTHRGVHCISAPVWLALRLTRDGYQLVPEDQR